MTLESKTCVSADDTSLYPEKPHGCLSAIRVRLPISIGELYSLYAPVSVHWEIGNAFSAMFKREKIAIELAKLALKAYQEIPIKLIEVPLEKALESSYSQKIYAYDAYLILCAQQTSTALLTLDKGQRTVANNIGIRVLEVEK